ncbi:MAG: zinc ribbon domain-containing protein [Nitrospinae bacterium]|nr:zinc ribbon domain-containing protein [Nitrospinota bacterium]
MIGVEILLVLVVMTAIGYPLFVQPKAVEVTEDGDEYHRLVSAKESAFVALRDLEFDFKTGKLDEEDYDQLKSRYESEAVAVLKEIDANQKPTDAIFCTSCGAKAEAKDKFCRSCGSHIPK